MTRFTLHLVRHGLTEWNAAHRIQGQTNSDLTDVGVRQATAVGRALSHFPLRALYASDLDRAQQTAARIQASVGLDIRSDPRLRETAFGVLEGLTWSEAESQHPEVYRNLWESEYDYVIPGGESRAQTLARALAAFEEYADRHDGEHVAAVSHGGLKAYFLRHVLRMPFTGPRGFKTENGSISTFECKNGRWRLLTWGAVAHLTAA